MAGYAIHIFTGRDEESIETLGVPEGVALRVATNTADAMAIAETRPWLVVAWDGEGETIYMAQSPDWD